MPGGTVNSEDPGFVSARWSTGEIHRKETMKAVIYDKYGPPYVLQLKDQAGQTAVIMELHAEEAIVKENAANFQKNIETVGSWLFLTSRRLVFGHTSL